MGAFKRRALAGEGLYVAIRDGEVYVHMQKPGDQTRLYAALMLLHRAVTRFPADDHHHFPPHLEFVLGHTDLPLGGPAMAWCRPAGDTLTWMYPDFSYYDWPEIGMPPYSAIRRRTGAVTSGLPFAARSNKLFWRGGSHRHVPSVVRKALLGKLERRADIADVKRIPPFEEIYANASAAAATFTALWDFCRHKYIIYTEGNSWSARLKFHLLCGSVLVSHPRSWDTPETLLMQEGRNVVSVRDNQWSDVEEVYWMLELNPPLAQHIADENRKFFHLLTPDGISCYILELLKCYAEAMTTDAPPAGGGASGTAGGGTSSKRPPPPPPLPDTSTLMHLEAFVLSKMVNVPRFGTGGV
ncbi:hypothetical protein HYH02_009258 [Chlamydomonas schloesseri]|uniref:Glycosyl transferase CAP10 domain-containing protein n=1 Tax=Chlamydomonas schloesseri TaxID=2026947 RepID=A0A835TPX7_9CHLO|nr:hypothetical protein HYH02_009258 [Chlamydomonas schloesseri]|eukprot:KAG2443181.1 hypothetical protein HYH02_009258 [Chlamydomonas schloesseri]